MAETLIVSDLPEHLEDALRVFRSRVAPVARDSQHPGFHFVVHQFLECSSDVEAAGRLLARAQRMAAESLEETAVIMSQVSSTAKWVIPSESPELETLRIVWKSWFFYVRAFCDLAYRLIFASLQDGLAGKGRSMNEIYKAGDRVGVLLAAEAPEVLPWFRVFRARRDEVKAGVNFSFTALSSPGVAITFNMLATDPGTGRESLYVGSDFRGKSLHLEHEDERELPFSTVVEDVYRLNDLLTAAAVANRRNG